MNKKAWKVLILCGFISLMVTLGSVHKAFSTEPGNEQPKRGGTLVIGLGEAADSLLAPANANYSDDFRGAIIYEGLMQRVKGDVPKPLLAESYEVSKDSLTVTFKLHKNVRWQDGEPFTSEDVKFTFEEIIPKYSSRASKNVKAYIDSIDTPDKNTVVFHFKKPFGGFMNIITSVNAGIAPKHVFAGTDILENPAATQKPVGTGPFKLAEWRRGDYMILKRNDDYWDKPKPYLDRIILKVIPNRTTLVNAFKANEIDVIPYYYLPLQNFQELAKMPDVKYTDGLYDPWSIYLHFNLRREPFKNKKVRQAIYTAINRQFIVDKVFMGIGAEVSKSAIDPAFKKYYNPNVDLSKKYAYDPEKANRMLDEAGYPKNSDGIRFKANLTGYTSTHRSMAEVIRENLKDVGIEVILEPLERAAWLEKVYTKADFDLSLQNNASMGDPTAGLQRLYLPQPGPPTKGYTNPTGYSNPEVTRLWKAAAETLDTKERAKNFYAVQVILAEDISSVPVVDTRLKDVAKKYVKGIWTGPYEETSQDFWIDK